MEHEVRIPKDAHFGTVETFKLGLFADTQRRDEITDLEPDIGHNKSKHGYDRAVDDLHEELREVAVQESAHAVGAVKFHHPVPHHAVPSCAVFARREDTNRQHAPETVCAVH